jgi:hypothetical protein
MKTTFYIGLLALDSTAAVDFFGLFRNICSVTVPESAFDLLKIVLANLYKRWTIRHRWFSGRNFVRLHVLWNFTRLYQYFKRK